MSVVAGATVGLEIIPVVFEVWSLVPRNDVVDDLAGSLAYGTQGILSDVEST
jgi:hypothetical protein